MWAVDLFTFQTLTFKTLYVLFFITHGRREFLHLAVIAHATAVWVWRQMVEATPWGRRPKHLFRDGDGVYGGDVSDRAMALGLDTVRTPVRAPRANAIAERVLGTIRRDSLDRAIAVDEWHLRTVLAEYVEFYNRHRTHRALQLEAPWPRQFPRAGPIRSGRACPVLNGLHHVDERAA